MEVREASAAYLLQKDTFCQKGFKQTEAGVIPEDWDIAQLPDIIWYQEGPGVRNYQFTSAGVKLFNGTNIENGRICLDKTSRYISEREAYGWYSHFLADAGDIVIACSGISVSRFDEKVGVLSSEHLPLCMNTSTMRFKIASPRLHKEYFRHFLRSQLFKNQISGKATGSAQLNFGPAHVRAVLIPLPTKAEQEAIAEALSDADALIESLEQLLAKKRHLKQGAMQQLLTGKKRLPGFSGEWEVKRLGDVAAPRNERIDPRKSGVQDFCIELEHIGSATGALVGCTSTGEQSSLKSVFRAGDVLFGKLRAYLKKYWYADRSGVCSTEIWVFSPKDNLVSSAYLFQVVQTDKFIEVTSSAYGTHMPRSDWNVVKNYELPLPPTPEEQTAIATLLSDMDAELAALEAKLAKARNLKQGMMQELLTGRIRLVQPTSNVMPFPEKAQPATTTGSHNKQINEAVIIGVLSKHFGTEDYPLPRKRRVKLMYLLHRYAEGKAEGYLKKAAGPYDPGMKYKGPETIALKNGYVREHHNGSYPGFVAGDKIVQAESYFEKWYGADVLTWLEQFRYKKTDELELLATVDMAMVDLAGEGRTIDLSSVKSMIADHPEWVPKLSRETFSDANIERAIGVCIGLFG